MNELRYWYLRGIMTTSLLIAALIISAAALIMASGEDSPTRPEYCTAENVTALIPSLNLIDQERRNLIWLSQQRGMGALVLIYQGAQDLLARLMTECVSR